MRKLLVFGSRTIKDAKGFIKIMKLYEGIDLIVTSKKTGGVDKMARIYSLRVLKKKPKTFQALWNIYGNRAGYLRNRQMAAYCTEAVGFWNGFSKGTDITINLLKEYNKPFKIFDPQLKIIDESG